MNSKLIITFIVLSIAVASNALFISCPVGICARTTCEQVTAEQCTAKKMVLKEHGGFCGCCNVCMTIWAKGEACVHTQIHGIPPTAQCDKGLVCDLTKHVCVEAPASPGECAECGVDNPIKCAICG